MFISKLNNSWNPDQSSDQEIGSGITLHSPYCLCMHLPYDCQVQSNYTWQLSFILWLSYNVPT